MGNEQGNGMPNNNRRRLRGPYNSNSISRVEEPCRYSDLRQTKQVGARTYWVVGCEHGVLTVYEKHGQVMSKMIPNSDWHDCVGQSAKRFCEAASLGHDQQAGPYHGRDEEDQR